MNDDQLLRYSRHILLPELDVAGQQRLLEARVLVLGLGGLGSAAALYLASSGVGTLVLADFDEVDLSNLQRQVLHGEADIGRSKVASAVARLQALNHNLHLVPQDGRLDAPRLASLVREVDLVVDCSDNFEARFALNQACLEAAKPLVSGAAIGLDGQLAVFDPRVPASPCYRCLYPRDAGTEDDSCTRSGVIAPLVGIVGCAQALEALKLIAGFGEPLVGRLLLLDARRLSWREMKLARDPQCPSCGGG